MKNSELLKCQTIYDINQDRKDVVCVNVFLSLKHLSALVAVQGLGQNQEARDSGTKDDVLWYIQKVIFSGT